MVKTPRALRAMAGAGRGTQMIAYAPTTPATATSSPVPPRFTPRTGCDGSTTPRSVRFCTPRRVFSRRRPPLMREHRLYQADWLMRFYGFAPEEIVDRAVATGCSIFERDPQARGAALRNCGLFPVDVKRAPRETLLAYSGPRGRLVKRILATRRHVTLRLDDPCAPGSIARRRPFLRGHARLATERRCSTPVGSRRSWRVTASGPRQLDLFRVRDSRRGCEGCSPGRRGRLRRRRELRARIAIAQGVRPRPPGLLPGPEHEERSSRSIPEPPAAANEWGVKLRVSPRTWKWRICVSRSPRPRPDTICCGLSCSVCARRLNCLRSPATPDVRQMEATMERLSGGIGTR